MEQIAQLIVHAQELEELHDSLSPDPALEDMMGQAANMEDRLWSLWEVLHTDGKDV